MFVLGPGDPTEGEMMLTRPTTEILLSLEPRPEAVAQARHALAARGLGPEMDHTVALLTSELIGNAVRHAGLRADQRIVFFARLAEGHVHVEVADPGPGFDPEVRHDTQGFGLRLLDKLATSWDVTCTERGCRVTVDIDRRRRRFPRDEDV